MSRIHSKLKIDSSIFEPEDLNAADIVQKQVFIKGNCIYRHKLAQFFYTTYDVRLSEDVVNPKKSNCNIMLLSNLNNQEIDQNSTVTHPFLYARVIGIYHANVVYTGPGMKNYEPMRFDFLHVRWFQLELEVQKNKKRHHVPGWASSRLDCLSFPPMAELGSFSFVDPSLVLRGCHLIPVFSLGKRYLDRIGLSSISQDNNDWKYYYVNRSDDVISFFGVCC